MNPNTQRYIYYALVLIALQAVVLWFFGQPIIAASGDIKLWIGEVLSTDNSQQISDWYTFSHIIHGFIFYGLLTYFFPRLTVLQKLIGALAIEIGWEILENTPMVINHYRKQALAVGYSGDSILNSLCDTLSMTAGFFFAWRMPIFITIALALFLEVWVGATIRDNLTLNIINLLYPFEFIHTWQSGG